MENKRNDRQSPQLSDADIEKVRAHLIKLRENTKAAEDAGKILRKIGVMGKTSGRR